MKTFLLVLLLPLSILAQIPTNYYNSAIGLSGYALKAELNNIITNGHSNQGYNNLYNGYQTTDTDNYYENDGTVLDMYSEKPNATDSYNYTHHSNKCGNYSSEGDCYNREHLMPQSWFNSAQPMKSDIHHVVPSDGSVNGRRGHYPLANVSSASWTSQNGSKRGSCADTGYSGIVFEPIDEFKGDIARIYFYMATRYEDNIGSWENANANGSDPVLDGSSDHVFEDWYLDVLIQWHTNDPVSQREIDRNNAAYDYQGNANPFISHPEWVNTVWNPIPDTENPTAPTNLSASSITESSMQLSWTASTDNVAVVNYKVYKNDAFLADISSNNYSVSGLNANTTYAFHIIAYDATNNASTESNSISETTLDTPNFIINENFNNCATVSANFTSFNEQSNKNWECLTQFGEDNSGSMQMNGYQEDVSSKDWLITTNSIDFSQYINEKLSVYLVHTYGTMSLELLYSTDYDGTSNPNSFTWSALPNINIETHNGSSSESVQIITNADISSLSQSAYIAFKYYSNGSPTRWTIDSFKIQEGSVSSVSNEEFNNTVNVFPNPSKNILNIDSDSRITHVYIYSYSGKLVLSQNNTKKINTSTLNRGSYLCKIVNEFGQVAVKNVVIR